MTKINDVRSLVDWIPEHDFRDARRSKETPTTKKLKAEFKQIDAATSAPLHADAAKEAAEKAQQAADAAAKAAGSIPKPAPDPRDAPNFELLQRGEGWAARISPRRSRWPDLQRIDERLVEIDQKQAQASAELHALEQARHTADPEYQAALADWYAGGQQGAKPVSSAAELDQRITETKAEIAAFDMVRERILEERVEFVARRRNSLAKDAAKETDERLARYLSLVDELEQLRDEVIACRQTAVWAALYPSDTLSDQVPFLHTLVGSRLKVQQQHLPGVTTQLPTANVFALLREDVRYCATALTTEQAAAISGASKHVIGGKEATWQGDDFERDLQRREKEAAIEAYTREWGVPPAEWA